MVEILVTSARLAVLTRLKALVRAARMREHQLPMTVAHRFQIVSSVIKVKSLAGLYVKISFQVSQQTHAVDAFDR